MKIPVKKTVWGAVDNVETLRNHIAKSGQFFGQDLSGPACNYNPSYPCDQTLYQYMGWGTHKGLDIPVSTDTEVYASHDGVVNKLSDSVTAGIGVVLRVEKQYETIYWHLKNYIVSLGQQVNAGDLIAYSDNTGYSAGPHLHYEYKVWKDNGYVAVDPLPYFVNKTMTEEEIKKQYALSFYRSPDAGELAYWTGRDLLEFLNTAIKDRAKFLNDQIL